MYCVFKNFKLCGIRMDLCLFSLYSYGIFTTMDLLRVAN